MKMMEWFIFQFIIYYGYPKSRGKVIEFKLIDDRRNADNRAKEKALHVGEDQMENIVGEDLRDHDFEPENDEVKIEKKEEKPQKRILRLHQGVITPNSNQFYVP